jgi:uncharacterized protein (DUF488 family)
MINMKSRELLTIGYEGRKIEEFIDLLKEHKVARLIDVRDIPISRKKGFSKSALREYLQAESIEYVHIKALGCPSAIRNKFKLDQNYEQLFKAYSKYLSSKMEGIEELDGHISDGVNCIMCFESDPERCHRSVIVDKIKEYDGKGLKIKHI